MVISFILLYLRIPFKIKENLFDAEKDGLIWPGGQGIHGLNPGLNL